MVLANSLMLQKYLCFKIFSFKSYFFAVIKRNAGELAELKRVIPFITVTQRVFAYVIRLKPTSKNLSFPKLA